MSAIKEMRTTSHEPKTATIHRREAVGFLIEPKRVAIKGVQNQTARKKEPMVRLIQISHQVTVDSSCLSMWPMTVSFFFMRGIRVTNQVPKTATIHPMAICGLWKSAFSCLNRSQFQKSTDKVKPPMAVKIHLSQNQIPRRLFDLNFLAIFNSFGMKKTAEESKGADSSRRHDFPLIFIGSHDCTDPTSFH